MENKRKSQYTAVEIEKRHSLIDFIADELSGDIGSLSGFIHLRLDILTIFFGSPIARLVVARINKTTASPGRAIKILCMP